MNLDGINPNKSESQLRVIDIMICTYMSPLSCQKGCAARAHIFTAAIGHKTDHFS